MSFNKIQLDNLATVKEEYFDDPERFIARYKKANVFAGPSDSIKFIQAIFDSIDPQSEEEE